MRLTGEKPAGKELASDNPKPGSVTHQLLDLVLARVHLIAPGDTHRCLSACLPMNQVTESHASQGQNAPSTALGTERPSEPWLSLPTKPLVLLPGGLPEDPTHLLPFRCSPPSSLRASQPPGQPP